MIKKLFPKPQEQLTDIIAKQRKELAKGNKLKRGLKIYEPSLRSFLMIAGIFVLLFLISRLGQDIVNLLPDQLRFILPSIDQEKNHYQNFIAISAGIGTVVFALTIFIAESFRDGNTDKGRVLLRESNIWPLTVSVILLFLFFLWYPVNFFAVFIVSCVGLFALWSLYRIIITLLSGYQLLKKREKLLVEYLDKSIDLAIEERLGDNILLSSLDKGEIKLEFHPFSVRNIDDFVCFKAKSFGIVSDINMDRLKEFGDLLEREANNSGFSFSEKARDVELEVGTQESTNSQTITSSLVMNRNRYITKKFHDVISEENSNLICFDKKIVKGDAKKIRKLEKIFNQIFTIKEEENFAEEVRYELSNLKDQCLDAIKEYKLGDTERLAKVYIGLAEGFLNQIIFHGGGYTFDQAVKERKSPFSGWEQIRWLSSDVRDLLNQAVLSNNIRIIGDIGYIPIAIARRSIAKNDHYLFQEFIGFSELLYDHALTAKDKQIKSFLIDRSWRYIKEIADIYVEPKLDGEALTEEELKSVQGFALFFFRTLQNLIKKSFDNRDIESFRLYKDALSKVFGRSERDRLDFDIENLEYRLKLDVKDSEKNELNRKLKLAKLRRKVKKDISIKRSQVVFGLSSWFLHSFQGEKDSQILKEFYSEMSSMLPVKIDRLTRVFLSSHNFKTEDFWDWDWWELIPDGGIQSIDILEKLEKLYAVKSLSILASMNDNDISGVDIPTNRDLAFLADGNRSLKSFLEEIKSSPDNWSFVLSPGAISKVDVFIRMLDNAKSKQENLELQEKKDKSISEKKRLEFMKDFLLSFYENSSMREIFKYYNLFDDNTNEPIPEGETLRFGINTVDDKAAFFDDWHVHFGGWGENYGRDMGLGENRLLLDEISKDAQEIDKSAINSTLEEAENIDNIFMIANSIAMVRFFEDSSDFEPYYHPGTKKLEVKSFNGYFKFKDKKIPVFQVHHNKVDRQVLILDRSKIGELVQRAPLNANENSDLVKDIFYMNIGAFSEDEELMNELISNPPDWLSAVGDSDAQREHLKERVLIKILERFKFIKSSDFKAYKISV